MEQYNVTGMSCAACSSRVEKAVSRVPGVTSCSVSLLTNSMGVEGTAGAGAIIKAVQDAGYGASLKGASGEQISASAAEEALEDHETPALKRRLIASVGFLLVLMYFSMGHMMWGWPLPAWFNDNHVASCTKYGYPCGTWFHGILFVECLCTFCNDKGTGGRRFCNSYELHDGVLF